MRRTAAPRAISRIIAGLRLSLQRPENLARGVSARQAADAAARMGAGAAQEQPVNRRSILRVTENRPHREELVERQLAVMDVAIGQP